MHGRPVGATRVEATALAIRCRSYGTKKTPTAIQSLRVVPYSPAAPATSTAAPEPDGPKAHAHWPGHGIGDAATDHSRRPDDDPTRHDRGVQGVHSHSGLPLAPQTEGARPRLGLPPLHAHDAVRSPDGLHAPLSGRGAAPIPARRCRRGRSGRSDPSLEATGWCPRPVPTAIGPKRTGPGPTLQGPSEGGRGR